VIFSGTNKQGAAGVSVAIAWFTFRGYNVCLPITKTFYDLVVDMEGKLSTVKVRTSNCIKKNETKYFVSLNTKQPVDYYFVLTGNRKMYLIPQGSSEASLTIGEKYKNYEVTFDNDVFLTTNIVVRK
jgi:hypothetical protein